MAKHCKGSYFFLISKTFFKLFKLVILFMSLHTDKSAAQIAEEMHFANPSFFSKYFRRLTGMTPGEFKKTKS